MPTRTACTNNFTEYPDDLPSFPRQLAGGRLRDGYIGKWHMGEENDEKRPGFDYFVTHKGQGKYFDTEFNVDGQRARCVPGYYTHVVTDLADGLDSQRSTRRQAVPADARPQGAAQLLFPGAEVRARLRRREVEYPDDGLQARRQARRGSRRGSTPGTASTARCSSAARSSPTAARRR